MNEQNKKRTAEDMNGRDPKRQRRNEEPTTAQLQQPTAAEHLHNAADIIQIPHDPTPSVTSSGPRMLDDTPTSGPACRLSKIAIPTKRRNPFGEGGSRKKLRIERYANVRIYAQRKDLEHTHEIQWALTPDGGLDLAGLAHKLKLKGCQVTHPAPSRSVALHAD
jgi:hypothetical protein